MSGKAMINAKAQVDRLRVYPPKEAVSLIKEALSLASGSAEPNRTKVGRLSQGQLRSIAETKMPDLNANDVEAAMLVIAGTARSMGVEVER